MNEKIDIKPKFLSPFKRFCMTIGELPTSYVETMSYYEMILWFTKYLGETVIPAINNNAEALKEVQNLFIELQNYVNDYFDNLDIQTEINNKLDDMAESGQLAEIIAQYLEVSSVLGFDTKSDLKGAENLIDGTIAKTIGDSTYNDGKGHFYKIREIQVSDVIDDNNILALTNYDGLVAEKLPDYYLNQTNDRIDNLFNKKILFIGDSYLTYGNGSNGIIDYFKSISGESNVIESIYSGTGFAYTVDSKNFVTLLNDVTSDNEVTDIIVVGGYNDQYSTQSDVLTAIGTFCGDAKTKFPNAQVYIAMAGFTLEPTKRYPIYLVKNTYSQCNKYGAIFLNGVECVMHDTVYFSDNTHPSADGRRKLAEAVYQAWKSGYYSFNTGFETIPFTYSGNASSGNLQLKGFISNNTTYIESQENRVVEFETHPNYTDIYNNRIEIGTLTLNTAGSIVSPWQYNMYPIPVTCAVKDSSGFRTFNGKLIFLNNVMYVQFMDAESTNWTDITGLEAIYFNFFQINLPTCMI